MGFVGTESASRPFLVLFTRKWAVFASGLARYRFGLAAFLISVGIRAIPEIIVGPYPVGWDTIAFYVPHTLDWAAGKLGLLQLLGAAPLMYMISIPTYVLMHVDPVWIFKVMGPFLYGLMIIALYRFLMKGLQWPKGQALGGALLTSLYFITLRISWDLYRNMLGLTFILLGLTIVGSPKKTDKAWLSIFITLAVAADQLTAVVALLLLGARSLKDLFSGDRRLFREGVMVGLPGATLFLAVVYAGAIGPGIGLLQQQPLVPSVDAARSSLGFLGYAYLPLAPLAILGLRRVRSFDLKAWLVLCFGLALTILVPQFGPLVVSYRWTLLMDIPVCVLAVAGILRLRDGIGSGAVRLKPLQTKLVPLCVVVFALTATLYAVLPAQRAMVYYTGFPGLVPTSMVQDTVPMSDMAALRELLSWVGQTMGPSGVLITHQAIYGWARVYLPPSASVLNYGYSDPLNGAEIAKASGFSSILMIWWVNGTGWHGQIDVPSNFVPAFQVENMMVYEYHWA